jgi:hypothetical protein
VPAAQNARQAVQIDFERGRSPKARSRQKQSSTSKIDVYPLHPHGVRNKAVTDKPLPASVIATRPDRSGPLLKQHSPRAEGKTAMRGVQQSLSG